MPVFKTRSCHSSAPGLRGRGSPGRVELVVVDSARTDACGKRAAAISRHPRTLVERSHLATQMAGEETRAACNVEDASGRQLPYDAGETLDVRGPARAVALCKQPRAKPPVVVLDRSLVVVRTHSLVDQASVHSFEPNRLPRRKKPRSAGPFDAQKRTRTSTQLAWTRPATW